MSKVYVDTNIFLDYLFDRMVGLVPGGYFAERLFEVVVDCRYSLVISELTIKELEVHSKPAKVTVEELFERFRAIGKLDVVDIDAKIISEARNIKMPLPDALHAAAARRKKAILVTRDRHFAEIRSVKVAKPEDLER